MDINMIIPKQIKVGYQNRRGTFTGKLAYVIYYDEKGVLRKKNSWESWIDSSIPTDDFINEPMEGFGINKKVGGYSTGWNYRQSYIRVYDPRGFEVEITVENLIYLIENTNYNKNKGFEDKLVYCWSGKDLVLMPVSSPDYKNILEYNELLHSKEKVSSKDLVVGGTYKTKQNADFVYLGYFDQWKSCYGFDGLEEYGEITKVESNGKKHFFGRIIQDLNSNTMIELKITKSPTTIFISTVSRDVSDDLIELQDLLSKKPEYSPIDVDNIKYIKYGKYEIKRILLEERWWVKAYLTNARLGFNNKKVRLSLDRNRRDDRQIVNVEYNLSGRDSRLTRVAVDLDEFIKESDVYYIEMYLKNGVKYKDTKYTLRN